MDEDGAMEWEKGRWGPEAEAVQGTLQCARPLAPMMADRVFIKEFFFKKKLQFRKVSTCKNFPFCVTHLVPPIALNQVPGYSFDPVPFFAETC